LKRSPATLRTRVAPPAGAWIETALASAAS